ncbi:uncharacterized protein LOC122004885 isoform X2 [Zingiber officinale]|uniref:uncharacterized protein LOC122004885 isoform X2 n=1 Tax=Zingiber officinale TaxID=94328 RepID=UPI001C4B741E|nr:uncharacterized protein LOC122004885 isoform X2 [Zingiber officinale]
MSCLDHPSISRFHLDRRSPRSLEAEVHGTWISGARILPNVTVDMVDGFTGFRGSLLAGRWRWRTRWNPLQKTKKKLLDDRADVVAGGRDKLPNAIPLVLPLPEFLSSCPLPPGIRQQSPERKEKEVEKSNFLSDVPTKILNSSPLPSVTEHQGASNDSEIGSEELKLSFCCANANFKLLDCATRNETAEP